MKNASIFKIPGEYSYRTKGNIRAIYFENLPLKKGYDRFLIIRSIQDPKVFTCSALTYDEKPLGPKMANIWLPKDFILGGNEYYLFSLDHKKGSRRAKTGRRTHAFRMKQKHVLWIILLASIPAVLHFAKLTHLLINFPSFGDDFQYLQLVEFIQHHSFLKMQRPFSNPIIKFIGLRMADSSCLFPIVFGDLLISNG